MTTIKQPGIADLFTAATLARQQGDRITEERHLDAILAIAPEDPQALNAKGMIALSKGEAAAAEGWFQKAAEQDPDEPALWMNVASAQRALGDIVGEERTLQRVLSRDQRHFMALLRLAQLHQRCNRRPQAVAQWRNVLSLADRMDAPPPALVDMLSDARAFVAESNAKFADFLDDGLAGALAKQAPSDARRFTACVDYMLGRRSIYQNECSGLHYPFLPADEFFDEHHFPWMAELEKKTPAIRREFEALLMADASQLRPYVQQQSGTPANKWTPLDGSLDWGACFLFEYGKRNDAVCDLCPETAAALEALPRADIPGRAPSAFFSILEPHAKIPPHTGVTNTRAIIHLPLIVPEGCGFRVGNETRQWKEGKAFAFDDTIEHEAWNESDQPRVVLIFDVWNPHLSLAEQQLLKQFYYLADKSGENPNI